MTEDRLQLGYIKDRDCIVVAFRNRLGGWSYLREESGELAGVATGYLGEYRKNEVTSRFTRIDEIFRELEQ